MFWLDCNKFSSIYIFLIIFVLSFLSFIFSGYKLPHYSSGAFCFKKKLKKIDFCFVV